jgi:hypothetical protein
MERIFRQIKRKLGLVELERLLYILSGFHNNYAVSKQFKIKVFRIALLSNNISEFCHYVLDEKYKAQRKRTGKKIYRIEPYRKAV